MKQQSSVRTADFGENLSVEIDCFVCLISFEVMTDF